MKWLDENDDIIIRTSRRDDWIAALHTVHKRVTKMINKKGNVMTTTTTRTVYDNHSPKDDDINSSSYENSNGNNNSNNDDNDSNASISTNKSTTKSTDNNGCLLYTSPSPRDGLLSRMPSSA